MKKILIFITTIGVLFFTSCDDRKSKIDRIADAVKVFNKNNRSINLIKYYPEQYTQIKTDSIVSKTFHVSIKNHSLMTDYITLKKTLKGTTQITKAHRVFESDVIVSVNNLIIYNKRMSSDKLKDSASSEFWNHATLEQVWVNQERSNSKQLSLGLSVINPRNNTFKLYEILIDKYGNERLILHKDYS